MCSVHILSTVKNGGTAMYVCVCYRPICSGRHSAYTFGIYFVYTYIVRSMYDIICVWAHQPRLVTQEEGQKVRLGHTPHLFFFSFFSPPSFGSAVTRHFGYIFFIARAQERERSAVVPSSAQLNKNKHLFRQPPREGVEVDTRVAARKVVAAVDLHKNKHEAMRKHDIDGTCNRRTRHQQNKTTRQPCEQRDRRKSLHTAITLTCMMRCDRCDVIPTTKPKYLVPDTY